MAQLGPLLRSVRSLIENLDAERLRRLPSPPMPVQLEVDENDSIIISLLVTLPPGDPGSHERFLGNLAEYGFRMTTWAGRIAAGYMSVRDTDGLEKVEGDLYIEAAHAVHPELDVSVPEAWHLPAGWSGYRPRGSGVLIGIVDTGIDPAHPSLRTVSGATRIVRLWDQTKKLGPAAWPTGYDYGAEWDSAAIDAYLAPTAGAAFPAKVAQHGTAVAGIAASNGLCAPTGRYVGVAPDADLVVVTLNASARNFAVTGNVIDAINYVFAVADELGKRAVVNLSQGSELGAHDPNEQFALGISELLAKNEKRIVVTSMGNTGEADAHASFYVPAGGSVDLEIDVPDHVGPYVTLELWYDVADAVKVQVIDPAGISSSAVDHDLPYGETLSSDKCDIRFEPNVPAIRANLIQVILTTVYNMGDVAAGRWIVRLADGYVPSGQPFHGWLARGKLASPSFASPYADPDCTMTQPAAASEVLPVSAYRLALGLGAFAGLSSRGPDRRGQALDALAAPGQPVTSCSAAPFYSGSAHVARSGTSYAAAHVTGAIALMLEAQPTMTRNQVIGCLLANARHDADTASGPASGWGAGKLDIYAALRCAAPHHMSSPDRRTFMPLRAEVTVVPGPVDPDAGQPSLDPPYEGALYDFLATPGVAGTEVAKDLDRELVRASQETEEGADLWGAIRWFFTGKRYTVLETGRQVVELGGYWVVPPSVSGASAELTVGRSSSSDKSASFTIAGIGGGPTITIGLEEDLTHEANGCVRITLTAVGVFQKIQVTVDGTVTATFPRLASLDTNNLSWTILPATPPDAASLGAARSTTKLDLSRAVGPTIQELQIIRGTTWDLSAGLDLPNLGGIKAQVSTKIKYEEDVKFKYTLPGGHIYTASCYDNFPAYLWSVS